MPSCASLRNALSASGASSDGGSYGMVPALCAALAVEYWKAASGSFAFSTVLAERRVGI